MKKITIAIDGYSSCGKSTMAKDLAREIGYIYIDSGAMYRAVTLYSLQKGFFTERGIDTEALKTAMPDIHISFRLNPETQRPMTFLNDTNVEDAIRSMEVSSHVSPIAALGFVGEAIGGNLFPGQAVVDLSQALGGRSLIAGGAQQHHRRLDGDPFRVIVAGGGEDHRAGNGIGAVQQTQGVFPALAVGEQQGR